MDIGNQQKLQRLYSLLEEIEAYSRSIGKLHFDMECCAPEEGMEKAGEDMAVLGKQLHKLTHAEEYTSLLEQLHENHAGLTPVQRQAVEHLFDDYSRTRNFTPEFAFEMDSAFQKAYGRWLAAKKQGDFSLYRDTMAELIQLTRRSIDLRDRRYASYYDACLDDYEKDSSCRQLDSFFSALRGRIVPLLELIRQRPANIRTDFLSREVPVPAQEECSRWLLQQEGLRSSALVLMTTEHPFTTNFGPGDVRVTTHYYPESFISNIFTTLHEGGHALFMQNEPEEVVREHCSDNMSNAMHETISRFYENIIGRSRAFIHFIYPKLLELTGDTFKDVSEEELYRAVNLVQPGLIRIEADELTYSLHIMVRYELEKAFINGDISPDDIPAAWAKRYRDYLGLEVPDDGVGCLQDVHWTGMFGYFPSYALGNAYSAQILAALQRELDVCGLVAKGELAPIASWLREKVFSIASTSTPDQWIRAITGESLNPDYYLDYLQEKYSQLYQLD